MRDQIRMDKPRWWVCIALALTIVIYGLSMTWRGLPGNILEWRWQIMMLTGIFTWSLLTLCMVMPLRWRWVGWMADGLDKGYDIHKWLGIAAVSVIFIHWLAVQSWRWLLDWGWLDGESDILADIVGRLGIGGAFPLDAFSRIGGGGAFFVMLTVVAVALIHKIPYHIFRAIHKVAPVIYLLGAVHVLNRIPGDWWRTPAAYILAAMTAVGVWGAVVSLRQAIGRKNRFEARLIQIEEIGDIIDITLEPERPFPHRSGQFAFLDFTRAHHGGHPFSMASHDPLKLRFVIKKLGDMTNMLDEYLEEGQTVTLEGPYGKFDFDSRAETQVWIAGGIGIAPFLARLEELATKHGASRKILLWYSAREEEQKFPSNLDGLCAEAGVKLTRVVSGKDDRLTADDVLRESGDLSQCSVWFCGPDKFGKTMQKGLVKKGLADRNFHTEEFDFR